MDTTKKCTKCQEIKNITEFYKNKTSKDGYQWHCKVCTDKANTEARKRNPEASRRAQAKAAKNLRDENPVEYYAKTTWTSLNQRCVNGAYANSPSIQANFQQQSYFKKGIECRISKYFYFKFWYDNSDIVNEIIANGDKPSIDRIDNTGHYELGNIRIIPWKQNITKTGKHVGTTSKEQYKKNNRKRYLQNHKKEEI